MIRIVGVLFIAVFCCVTIGSAGWENDVKQAFNERDSAGAFRIVKQEAESGNAEAQNFLGTMYINGVSVPPDEVEGLALLMVAAQNGSATASRNTEFMKTRMKKEHVDKANDVARNHRLRRGR